MDNVAKHILKDVTLEEIAPRVKERSPIDHWSSAVLLERAAYLKKLARFGDGSASETLREYPRHLAMLSFATILFVLAGAATLVTGGTLTHARTVGPGETRGDSIEGGDRLGLKCGDVAHVPAGLPHQLLVAGETTVTCLVIKVEEA
jgi:hypothetical protein